MALLNSVVPECRNATDSGFLKKPVPNIELFRYFKASKNRFKAGLSIFSYYTRIFTFKKPGIVRHPYLCAISERAEQDHLSGVVEEVPVARGPVQRHLVHRVQREDGERGQSPGRVRRVRGRAQHHGRRPAKRG